jgi:hypothetical protein
MNAMRSWKYFACAALVLGTVGAARAADDAARDPMEEVIVAVPHPVRSTMDEIVAATRPTAPIEALTVALGELDIPPPRLEQRPRDSATAR